MECFNELLLKLREVHEREVEGWQVKVQELSNKKGCDTKRMEELFTRNQQMKEQQRILTENIKTLENRLRAGLCDRCTVTQEVARRRQQEFEASQIHSLQHISLLTAEMTNLKKENRRLRDDIRTLKAALEDQSERSNSSSVMDGKPPSSPDRPPSSGPEAGSRSREQPAEGDMKRKTEAEQQDEETEGRTQRTMSHLDSYKHLLVPTVAAASVWRPDNDGGRAAERRAAGVEALGQRSSFPSHPTSKSFSSSSTTEVKPSRHLLHAPVPRHPQPIKASALSLPWPLVEPADWVTLTAVNNTPLIQTSPRIQMSPFPSLTPGSQQLGARRPMLGAKWQKQSPPPPSKEPTVVVSLSALPEFPEVPSKPPEEEERPSSKGGRGFPAGLRDPCDAPLDLSDRGKAKSSQSLKESSIWASPSGSKVRKTCETFMGTDSPVKTTTCSPSPEHPQPLSPMLHAKEEEQEADVSTEQENKKVPVLTISLRPVVVLENLNSALQKQDSLPSNGKPLSPADEPDGSLDSHDKKGSDSEPEQNCKRKRSSMGDNGESTDTDNTCPERKIKITVRTEEKSNG